MEIISGAALAVSFAGYMAAVRRRTALSVYAVPVVTFCGVLLILYTAGFLGLLSSASLFIWAGGLVCALICLIPGRAEGGGKVTGFQVCFLTGALLFLWVIVNLRLIHYDNFSHWALAVKSLFANGHYPDGQTELVVFKDYPPGMAVFLYYFCRFLRRSESAMLIGQNTLLFAAFFAIFGMIRETKRFLPYAFLGMGCCMLSYLNLTIRINSLLVDFLLPVLALAAVAILSRFSEMPLTVGIGASLVWGTLGILKNTGIFFFALSFFSFLLMLWQNQELKGKKQGACILFAGISAFLPMAGWRCYMAVVLRGFESKFEISTGKLQAADPAFYPRICREFISQSIRLSSRAFQVFLFMNLASFTLVWFARRRLKKSWNLKKILWWADGAVFLYYLGILGMYLYVMPEEEALRLAGMERYSCSIQVYFAGILCLQIVRDIEHSFAVAVEERGKARAFLSPGSKRIYQYGVMVTVVIGVYFLSSEINGLLSVQEAYGQTLAGRVRKLTGDRWYDGGEDRRTYLVIASDREGEVSDWSVYYVCRYFLCAPHVEVVQELDEERAEELLEGYDYVLVLDPGKSGVRPGLYSTDRIWDDS